MDWPPQSLKEAWRTFPEDYLKNEQNEQKYRKQLKLSAVEFMHSIHGISNIFFSSLSPYYS